MGYLQPPVSAPWVFAIKIAEHTYVHAGRLGYAPIVQQARIISRVNDQGWYISEKKHIYTTPLQYMQSTVLSSYC